MEHELFATDYLKILTKHHKFWQTPIFVPKSNYKYTTGNKVKYDTTSTTHHLFGKICAVHFSNLKCTQHNFTYRIFTECINLRDLGANISDTRQTTISLLIQHQYRSKYKLRIKQKLWKIRRRNFQGTDLIHKKNTSIHTDVVHTGLLYTLFAIELTICFAIAFLSIQMYKFDGNQILGSEYISSINSLIHR